MDHRVHDCLIVARNVEVSARNELATYDHVSEVVRAYEYESTTTRVRAYEGTNTRLRVREHVCDGWRAKLFLLLLAVT